MSWPNKPLGAVAEFIRGKRQEQFLQEGDLLVSTANSFNLVGKACWVGKLNYSATAGGFISILRPKVPDLDRKFLFYWITSEPTQNMLRLCGRQTTNISNLSFDRAEQLQIPLPPLPIQKKIAAVLEKADELRRKREEQTKRLDDLLQATFLDMFGDPVTNPKGWPAKKMLEICSKITDGTHHSPAPQTSGVPYITAKHLKPGVIDFYSNPTFVSKEDHKAIFARCNPRKGDVLYIKDGATTGAAAVNQFGFEFSMLSSLALLRPNLTQVHAEYICDFLNNPTVKSEIIRNVSGAAITRLTLAKIKEIKIAIPPVTIQTVYSQIRNKIQSDKLMLIREKEKQDNLFNSLMQRAFKGELDLV